MPTTTITFGDVAENHAGMQKIGKEIPRGLTYSDLRKAQLYFEKKGYKTEMIKLKKLLEGVEIEDDRTVRKAYVLIIRNYIKNTKALSKEHKALLPDTKAYMRGKVCNKHARHNLCFADFDQEAKFEEGKGTIVNFSRLPETTKIRDEITKLFSPKIENPVAEGNYYFSDECGIGWHGDGERKFVFAVRLGDDMDINYAWYHRSKRVSEKWSTVLHDGDAYIMSLKAVGYDWKKSSRYTLRHSAGNSSFTK